MNQVSNKNKQQNRSRKKDSERWFSALSRIYETPLKWYSKLVYPYLCSRCGGGKDYCFPSLKTISKDLGISKPTVLKALKELEANFFIKKQRVKDGKFIKNIYTLLSTPWHVAKNDLPPRSTRFTTPVNQFYPKYYKEKENTNKESACVENEENVFDSKAQDKYISTRKNEDVESPTPGRDFDVEEKPVLTHKKKTLHNPPPVSDEPSPHRILMRRAADRLLRQALGKEKADLSDIYFELEKLKKPSL